LLNEILIESLENAVKALGKQTQKRQIKNPRNDGVNGAEWANRKKLGENCDSSSRKLSGVCEAEEDYTQNENWPE
jgi:hypothetical protein